MKWLDCPLKYVVQTGRALKTRYKEYIQAIRSNNYNSEHLNHILKSGHTYGTIRSTMDIIKTGRKGKHLNILEICI
jgi:hypothetical protein